jgi:hypothetical protein
MPRARTKTRMVILLAASQTNATRVLRDSTHTVQGRRGCLPHTRPLLCRPANLKEFELQLAFAASGRTQPIERSPIGVPAVFESVAIRETGCPRPQPGRKNSNSTVSFSWRCEQSHFAINFPYQSRKTFLNRLARLVLPDHRKMALPMEAV